MRSVSLRALAIQIAVGSCAVACASAPQPSAPPVATPPLATPPPPVASTPAPAQGPLIRAVTAAELGASWRPGCPVNPDDLRRVELDYLGFDGRMHRGTLVIHRDVVEDVTAIFADLLRQRYPLAQIRTVEQYPNADDELSMRDNNTSAFNCRPLPNSTQWSLHAYGRAVDVNPLINPFIDAGGRLEPATAGEFLDRTRDEPGMLRAGSPAVAAFTDRGWRWGGAWRDPIDYQHFEKR